MRKVIVIAVVIVCVALIACLVAQKRNLQPVSALPEMSVPTEATTTTPSNITSPPHTTEDEICGQKWGAHTVWAGASDVNNVPMCDCDTGYIWQNNDGTFGTTYGPGEQYDFISAPGKCLKQQ